MVVLQFVDTLCYDQTDWRNKILVLNFNYIGEWWMMVMTIFIANRVGCVRFILVTRAAGTDVNIFGYLLVRFGEVFPISNSPINLL